MQNPTYEFAEDGVYTVSLTVTESDVDTDTMTKTDYITVSKVDNVPYKHTPPSHSDGATEFPIGAVLNWTGGDPDPDPDPDAGDTVTYNVYFGISMSPPLAAENHDICLIPLRPLLWYTLFL